MVYCCFHHRGEKERHKLLEHGRQERTDRLETTLQTLQSFQQTGILNMERARGGVRETASIAFLEGEPVEATAGELYGEEALEWILTWGSCRYTFEVRFPSEIVVPPPPLPPTEVATSTSPLAFFSQVAQKYTHAAPDGLQAHDDNLEEYSLPGTPPVTTPQSTPSSSPRVPLPPASPAPSLQVPYRLLNGPQTLSYLERSGLSRLHRHVFFLLDGQRNIIDIVRVTGRSFQEIQQLLADLERLKLIRQAHVAINGAQG